MLIIFADLTSSQIREENAILKWGTWVILQAIPSPLLSEDKNEQNSGLKFGLEWQIIPVSYSFNSNKYVSKLSFFCIRPVKRFSGSAELFIEPSVITGNYKYSNLGKFSYKSGCRVVFPIAQRGEYLAVSIGAGYYGQKSHEGVIVDGLTYEAGVYSFYGMLGLKFSYNHKSPSRYNFGLYFKYY